MQALAINPFGYSGVAADYIGLPNCQAMISPN